MLLCTDSTPNSCPSHGDQRGAFGTHRLLPAEQLTVEKADNNEGASAEQLTVEKDQPLLGSRPINDLDLDLEIAYTRQVSIRQHTSAYVSIRIRQHTSAYVNLDLEVAY
jgi:hypothetical protein